MNNIYYIHQDSYHQSQRVNYLNLILIFFSVIFISLPLGFDIQIPYTVKISVLLLWYIDCMFVNRKAFSKIASIVITCFAIVLLEIFYRVWGYSSAAIGNYYNTFIYYDIIIKAFYVMFAYSLRARTILFRLIQCFLMIVCYFNGLFGETMERLYDEGGMQYLLAEMETAVTPTEYYNMLIFYVAANILVLIYEKSKAFKILDIIAIVSAFYFIFSYHTRATSLFLMIILSCIVVLQRKTNKYNFGKIIGSFAALSALAIGSMAIFGDFIYGILPERVSERSQAMFSFVTGQIERSDSEYLSRFGLNMISIKTWLSSTSSFFFGIGNHLGRDYYGIIGQHAYYFDYLAKYGIIGMSFILVSLRVLIKTSKKFSFTGRELQFFAMFFFIYVLLGFIAKSAFAIIALGAFLYSLLAISAIKYNKILEK